VIQETTHAALGGWEDAFREALERYCDHCRSLSPRELQRRPRVLLDFDCWADPQNAARGHPIAGWSVDTAARALSDMVKRRAADPYALLGAIARECEK